MDKPASNNIIKVVTYTFFGLIVLALVGFLAYFTNGFTSDFKTFYVSFNNDMVTTSLNIDLEYGEEYRFDCNYVFGFLSGGDNKGYNVNVTTYVTEETDFYFNVDDELYKYSDITDITEIFNIVKYETYFILNIDLGMEEIIANFYSGRRLGGLPDMSFNGLRYFSLKVSSYNYEVTIIFNFSISRHYAVEEIVIDTEVLII